MSAPDAVLLRDRHPVAAAAELQPGKLLAARLLQQDLVLWRTPVGVRAWEDRCPPPFPEYHDPALRKVVCGPYVVETSGPRIVENFLDMARFPSVHPGILGDPKRTEVRDYEVAPFDDGEGQLGLIATGCRFWQMLLQRVAKPAANALSSRQALELATRGGAAALGRDDIGSLEPGKAADVVAFRVDDLEHAGALADPVAALVTCAPGRAWVSVIDGRIVVERGKLAGVDLGPAVERHNRISRRMLEEAGLA